MLLASAGRRVNNAHVRPILVVNPRGTRRADIYLDNAAAVILDHYSLVHGLALAADPDRSFDALS
jgi:hypothetical protein